MSRPTDAIDFIAFALNKDKLTVLMTFSIIIIVSFFRMSILLHYVTNRFFMKLFTTKNIEIVKYFQEYFGRLCFTKCIMGQTCV